MVEDGSDILSASTLPLETKSASIFVMGSFGSVATQRANIREVQLEKACCCACLGLNPLQLPAWGFRDGNVMDLRYSLLG